MSPRARRVFAQRPWVCVLPRAVKSAGRSPKAAGPSPGEMGRWVAVLLLALLAPHNYALTQRGAQKLLGPKPGADKDTDTPFATLVPILPTFEKGTTTLLPAVLYLSVCLLL